MAITTDRTDCGILLYATGNGSGSYKRENGVAGTVRTLTASNWIASDWFSVGALSDYVLTVSGQLAAVSCDVVVERRRRDQQNTSLFYPAIVGTVRGDAPSTAPAASQRIAPADFQRGTGAGADQVSAWPAVAAAAERLDVALLTTDLRASGDMRVLLKPTGAPNAADVIIVALNAR